MPKMGGPFIPVPGEVIDLFVPESGGTFKYYVLMLRRCFLEPREETATEWVGAFVNHSQRQIVEKLGGTGHLRERIFPRWFHIGVVQIVDGLFYLPMYYKKGDQYFTQKIMRGEIADLKKANVETLQRHDEMSGVIGEMTGTIAHLLGLLSERQDGATIPVKSEAPPPVVKALGLASSLLTPESKTVPATVRNKMISIFYREIGQDRISGQVRGSALKVFDKLLKDGFAPYQIALAIDWTVDTSNVSQKIRSFGIISTTISQAVAALEAKAEREAVVEEREQKAETEARERQKEMEDRDRMEQIKKSLSDEDRERLASRALAEIRAMGVFQESLITQVLIGIQENKILKEEEATEKE